MATNKKAKDTSDKHHSGMEGKTNTTQHSGKNTQFNSGSGGVTQRNTHRTGAGSAQSEIRHTPENSGERGQLDSRSNQGTGRGKAGGDRS